MMQGARTSSSTKKLVKVNMPSTFFALCKARKKKNFSLKWITIMMFKSPIIKETRSPLQLPF